MSKLHSFSYIKPLYYWCVFLGITPPHNFGQEETSSSPFFKCYTLLLIVITSTVFAYSIYGRENVVYSLLEPTVATTDRVTNLFSTGFTIVTRFMIIFINPQKIKFFLNKTYKLSLLNEFSGFTPNQFWIHFLIFQIYMIALQILDTWIWVTSVGMILFKFFLLKGTSYYTCNLVMFLMLHFALILKNCFRYLNRTIVTTTKKILSFDHHQTKNYHDLKQIGKYHYEVCTLIEIYNKIFGIITLLAIFVVILYILHLVDLFLVYAIRTDNDINGSNYGPELIVTSLLFIGTLLIMSLLLAHSCNAAMTESCKTTTICYVLLNKMPTVPKTYQEQVVKEELLLLAQQTSVIRSKFSAAGFLNVDFTLLGFILGSVTSYIIVSVQFIK